MSKPVLCTTKGCGNHIGEEITINGITLFHCGGVINREQRGWCAQCGQPFYWSAGDAHMRIVIAGLQIKQSLPVRKNAE